MFRRRDPRALIFSVVVHVILATAILSAAFHYDFSRDSSTPRNVPVPEHVSYVRVAPMGGIAVGTDTSKAGARSKVAPRGLVTPKVVPPTITPLPPAPTTQPGGVDGGTGRGQVAAVTGIVPTQPDPRLNAEPMVFYPVPKSHAEKVDSAVRAAFSAYNDSVARAYAMRGKDPGDWTFEKNGQKWGMDPNKIYLGKFAIPSAVLAALPIRVQGNPGEGLADRLAPTRRADIMLHASAAEHDDDFNAAIRRIRERKDKERAERQAEQQKARYPDLVP
jgi:hypothetical protein